MLLRFVLMEPNVVGITPPFVSSSKTQTPEEVVTQEVMDMEQYEVHNKGKAIQVELGSSSVVSNSLHDQDSLIYDVMDETHEVTFKDLFGDEDDPTDDIEQNSSLDMATPVSYALPLNNHPFHYSKFPFSLISKKSQTLTNFSNHIQPLGAPAPASFGHRTEDVISAPDSSRVKKNSDDYLSSYMSFKRFDFVKDFSDHQYASMGTTWKQHSKDWVKRIQKEWQILENNLPEMIFVRACEYRMDLLRAVIIGAEGTPYHDGLFFFDIFFPVTYPSMPPSVHYHSGGLRINPNLYGSGKVCLSLLGTWMGNEKEIWIPKDSTMLQVLVSIQGLILNQKPYFNEPAYEITAGTTGGETRSKNYNEKVFLHSLKTMGYSMRKPPKHFEDFVYGHFFSRAHDVLKACKSYKNGAPVGSLVKGGVEDMVESSESNSDMVFTTGVDTIVKSVLLQEFILLGVLGLEDEGEDKPSETKVSSI